MTPPVLCIIRWMAVNHTPSADERARRQDQRPHPSTALIGWFGVTFRHGARQTHPDSAGCAVAGPGVALDAGGRGGGGPDPGPGPGCPGIPAGGFRARFTRGPVDPGDEAGRAVRTAGLGGKAAPDVDRLPCPGAAACRDVRGNAGNRTVLPRLDEW